jgi:hypothetical protein
MKISRRQLRKSKPENLLRLAKVLKLRTDGMSHRQIAALVYWRITRHLKLEGCYGG